MDLTQFYTRRNGNNSVAAMSDNKVNLDKDDTSVVISETAEQSFQVRTLAGFLYSVSHTTTGEFWPVYEGDNSVGNNENNDIFLNETSVSEQHANIVACIEDDKLCIYIQDKLSDSGTFCNGQRVKTEKTRCHNGDIITFGNSYQALLLFADARKYALAPSPLFNEGYPQKEEEKIIDIQNEDTVFLNKDDITSDEQTKFL